MRHSSEETASEAIIVLTAGRSSAPSIHLFPPRRSARECASDRPDVIASAAASVSTALLPVLVGDCRNVRTRPGPLGAARPGSPRLTCGAPFDRPYPGGVYGGMHSPPALPAP